MKTLILVLSVLPLSAFATELCGSVQLHHTFAPPYVIKDHFSLNPVNNVGAGAFLTGANRAVNEALFAEGQSNDERNNKGQDSKLICVEGTMRGDNSIVDTMIVRSLRDAE